MTFRKVFVMICEVSIRLFTTVPRHSMGLPYMPTLTPKATPTDRHIWHTWSVWGRRHVRSSRPASLHTTPGSWGPAMTCPAIASRSGLRHRTRGPLPHRERSTSWGGEVVLLSFGTRLATKGMFLPRQCSFFRNLHIEVAECCRPFFGGWRRW